jgi:hypothetical protein
MALPTSGRGKLLPGMLEAEQESGPTASVGFPNRKTETVDRAGINDRGYLDKNGTESGLSARFNFLPPGIDIENQNDSRQHDIPFKQWKGHAEGYLTVDTLPGNEEGRRPFSGDGSSKAIRGRGRNNERD